MSSITNWEQTEQGPEVIVSSTAKKEWPYSQGMKRGLLEAYRFLKRLYFLYPELTKSAKKEVKDLYNRSTKGYNRLRQQLRFDAVPTGRTSNVEEQLVTIATEAQSLFDHNRSRKDWKGNRRAVEEAAAARAEQTEDLSEQTQDLSSRRRKIVLAGLAGITTITPLLAGCIAEPTPITATAEDPSQEETEANPIDQTEDLPIIGEEATEGATVENTPEEPLEVELTGTAGLDQQVKDNLDEQTSEFVEAAANSINQNPELKAALYDSEGGLKVAFDPARLIYHDGMWGYFAPEGGPLGNNLLIISTVKGKEGEILFASLDGASSILGTQFNESDYYLDFANIAGNHLCLVRSKVNGKEEDGEIVAATNAAGRWSLPRESGFDLSAVTTSAKEAGSNALIVAQEETAQQAIAEHMISHPLEIDLNNLANAPGVTGQIAAAYPEFQEVMNRTFPMEVQGEMGTTMQAVVTDFILYTDYDSAPRLYDKVITIEIELTYLDANQQEQHIYFPLRMYDEKLKSIWQVGSISSDNIITRDNIKAELDGNRDYTSQAMDLWIGIFGSYLIPEYWGVKQISFNNDGTGWVVTLDTIYPNSTYAQNSTHGKDFALLGLANPPYTKEDLANFQATGDPQYLLQINGKAYFWPAVNLLGSRFNILKDNEFLNR